MKIVIAPDSFKESLSALDVANAIEQGFKHIFPHAQYCKIPMADGGEGTVQAMVDATGGRIIKRRVTGPLGTQVNAFYGILGQPDANGQLTAVIEMAAASGLHLVPPPQRNPLITTSFGVGELIADALNQGIKHIILGLGGSATNDAGAGMMQALGAKLTDMSGSDIAFGGAALANLHHIDIQSLHPNINDCQIEVACDVDNPLCGPRGASVIFGPQKGGNESQLALLEKALENYADLLKTHTQKSIHLEPGAGAAGAGGVGGTGGCGAAGVGAGAGAAGCGATRSARPCSISISSVQPGVAKYASSVTPFALAVICNLAGCGAAFGTGGTGAAGVGAGAGAEPSPPGTCANI